MADIEQIYEPTIKENALLEVLLNPDNRRKSVTEICRLAGCSRQVWYDAFDKSDFRALYETKVKDLVKQSIGPIVNAFVEAAKRGEYQQGKVILEMAGLYNEKSSVDVSVSGELQIQDMSREQRRARMIELLCKKQDAEIKPSSGGNFNE